MDSIVTIGTACGALAAVLVPPADTARVTVWHALYLVWLVAGASDFLLHRRSHIEATSGLRESSLHLLQIALLGTATVLWLLFADTPALWFVLLAMTCLHALTGYWDTRIAYPTRDIIPLEQHVHSILDLAPWIALGAIGFPLLSPHHVPTAAAFTVSPAPLPTWTFALVPGLLLSVVPGVYEYHRCRRWAARAQAPKDRR